jgi:hypothetical protein
MFCQTEFRGVDHHLKRAESVAYPTGVIALAAGRLVASAPLARNDAVASVSLCGQNSVGG